MEYKGIRDIRDLFDEIDEDYFKPIKTRVAFDGSYTEYESKGDKKRQRKKLSMR